MRKFIGAGAVKNRILLSLVLAIPFILLGEVLYLPAFLIFNYMVAEDYDSQLVDMRLLLLLGVCIILIEISAGPITDKPYFKYIFTPVYMYIFLQGMRNFTATIMDSPKKADELESQAVPGEIGSASNTDISQNIDVTMPFLPAFYAGLLTMLVINKLGGGITLNIYHMQMLSGFLEILSMAVWVAGFARIRCLKLNLKPAQEIHYQLGDGDVYVIPILSMLIGSLINTYFVLWMASIYIIISHILRKYILKRGKA